MVALLILVIVLLVVIIPNIRIVPQAHAYVVERLGAYKETWPVGLHVKVPLIDRVAKNVNLKEQVIDFPPQPVITKDNVTMQIDTGYTIRSRIPVCTATAWKIPLWPSRT